MNRRRRISRSYNLFFVFIFLLIPLFVFLASGLAADTDGAATTPLGVLLGQPDPVPDAFEVNLPQDLPAEKKEAPVLDTPELPTVPTLVSEVEKKVKDLSQETVTKIQKSLKQLGYDVEDTFGIIGDETSAAIKKFRDDFDLAEKSIFSSSTIESLFHYAEIAKAHPDWRKIMLSKDFDDWVKKQPKAKRLALSQLRRSGTAKEIITMLDAYKASKGIGLPTVLPEKTAVQDKKKETVVSAPPVQIEHIASDPVPLPIISAGAPAKKTEAKSTTVVIKKKAVPTKSPVSPSSEKGTEESKAVILKESPKTEAATESADADDDDEAKEDEPEVTFDTIVQYAEEKKGFDPQKAVQWEGGECGCVKDLKGVVYGFYPFWTAGEPQQIDFSLLSRIGYYGLSFDRYGEISKTLQWNPNTADFIIEAQKFRTKVDLVIYKSDWNDWFNFSTKDRLLVLEKTTDNLVSVIDQKIAASIKQNIKTLVASEFSSTMGDGLTLFFDNYPEDDRAVAFFVEFVKLLREKMTKANGRYQLNLMLRMEDIGSGIYSTDTLERFMGTSEGVEDDDIALFLVGLHEPTTNSKKALRLNIEKEFKGIHRKNMLRKIVPVINPKTQAKDDFVQFTDDLIYFEDNFGGVGFLPLPFLGAPETETINKTLSTVFIKTNDTGFIARKLDAELGSFCKLVCPNRWLFRLAFDVLFVLFVLYFSIALWNVELRILFSKYRLTFLALALLALFILYSGFMCDPYWRDKRDGVTIVFILIGGLAWIWRNYLKIRERAYP